MSPALGPPDFADNTKIVDELHDRLVDLHDGMPASVSMVDVRLLMISDVLSWPSLKVYEDVDDKSCFQQPYAQVTEETWAQSLALSWRWGNIKPVERPQNFSPMTDPQWGELHGLLRVALVRGLKYVWIDWSCMPQYSLDIMVEILRSKVRTLGRKHWRVLCVDLVRHQYRCTTHEPAAWSYCLPSCPSRTAALWSLFCAKQRVY